MEDLLFGLCRICNIHEAKYTCPRCSFQTCSLPCSRRHKLRASCSGIRDPTVFKPRSQLATPSGIDHDYNFLHSIEHRIERSEKLIVEERGLVDGDELELARTGEDTNIKRRHDRPQPAEEQIRKHLLKNSTTVMHAPKGMRRNLENETNWSRNQRTMHWQVEWVREGGAGRILGKAMGKKPIGEVYGAIMEQERKRSFTDEEWRMEKKRKATEHALESTQRLAKKAKSDSPQSLQSLLLPSLQDPETGAWNFTSVSFLINNMNEDSQILPATKPSLPSSHHLYLLRPRTPSCYPKVLVPLDPSQSLEIILRRRTVLEFPTIYVLEIGPDNLPEEKYMLERDFFSVTGQGLDPVMSDAKAESSSGKDSSENSDTSTSGSDEDEEAEDGEIIEEILPTVWGRRR